MGEYERSSTAVISAYIAPGVVAYMERIAATLRERGLSVPLLVVQNNGGSLPVERVRERPAALPLSGPAAGVGALACAERRWQRRICSPWRSAAPVATLR